MVNYKAEFKKFSEINLNKYEKYFTDIPENIRESVQLYNQALESIQKESEDIAVIELKKAIAINPHFYEAMNMLGLCYISMEEYSLAEETFKKVAEAENNGIKAMSYIKSLGNDTEADNSNKKTQKRQIDKNIKDYLNINSIIKYFAGFVLGFLIMFLFSYSYIFKEEDAPVIEGKGFSEQERQQLMDKLDENENMVVNLQKDNSALSSELASVKSQLEYYTSASKLVEIDILVSEGEYEEAADLLILLKSNSFEGKDKAKFNLLNDEIIPLAVQKLYSQGYNLCQQQQKYQEALDKFIKIYLYNFLFEKYDALLYYTGKCYQLLNDYSNAVQAYNRILNEYPSAYYAQYAKNRLAEIPQEYRN